MSKRRVRWSYLGLLAVAGSGALAACGQTSKDSPNAGGGAGSSASSVAGDSGEPRGGVPSDSTSGGTVHSTSGGIGGGAMGGGGATQVTGGTAGSSGGDDSGMSGGDGGDSGADAGAAGAGVTGPIVEPYFRAGSRLKPRVYRAGDLEVLDTVSERSWYDVETREWCDFRVGADGIERCLPSNEFQRTESVPTYLDAACSRRAQRGYNQYCGSAISYFTEQPVSGCSYRAYRLGAPLPYDAPVYEERDGRCQRLPAANDSSLSVWPLEEVPPETFVAVNRVSRPHHPEMNALVREGEDGSSEIVGFSEPGREVPCFPLGLDATPHLCVPGWVRPWTFGDAACTERIAVDTGPRCTGRTTSVFLEAIPFDAHCAVQSITGLWESAGVRSTSVFRDSSGICEMISTEPEEAHVQGASIDLASLPGLEVIEVGNGPLRLPFYGFGGVPFLPAWEHFEESVSPGPFIDAASGESCAPRLFEDGTWRCVPSTFQATTEYDLYYESEDCTGQPAFLSSNLGSCLDQPARRGVVVETLESIPCLAHPVTGMFELGEEAGPIHSLSRPQGSNTCRTVNGEEYHAFRLNEVNPTDLSIPMERTLKD
jgi:hypothetical protein